MRALRICAAVLALTALPRSPAWACSCVTAPAQTYLARSAAAFAGVARVVEPPRGGVVVATFTVTDVYKGSVASEATVFTGADVAGCGIAFTAGRTYTVFAGVRGEAFITDLCSGTARGTLPGLNPVRRYGGEHSASPAGREVALATTRPSPSPRTLPIAGAAILACAVTVGILRRSSAR